MFPRWEAGAAVQLDPLPKARAFMQVADNCFNYQVLGARGFAALGRLIDASDAYTFRYSNLHEAMALFGLKVGGMGSVRAETLRAVTAEEMGGILGKM